MARKKAKVPVVEEVEENVSTPPSSANPSPSPEPEPEPEPEDSAAPSPVPQTPASGAKRTPRARKKAAAGPAQVFTEIPSTETATVAVMPVTVSMLNDDLQATIKEGHFEHQLKLSGVSTFRIETTTFVDEGPYAGNQIIIIKPSPAFPFMKLPPELRNMIYQFYFGDKEGMNQKISIVKTKFGVKAKEFNADVKHRTAILYLNREIAREARVVLYDRGFRFEDTSTLLQWLTTSSQAVRDLLSYLEVITYRKPCAGSVFAMLCDCRSLNRLHIGQAVGTNSTPNKAAKAFYHDAKRFIDAVARRAQNPDAAMDILRFGRTTKCFSIKDGNEVRAWTPEEKEEFVDTLKECAVQFNNESIAKNIIKH